VKEKACSLTKNDVFTDIGSGVGNVITQVAQQSNVACSIGLEIRSNVAKLGKRMIKEAVQQFLQLEKRFMLKMYAT
jgi:tRNA G46 methylase TrmB